MSPPIISRPSGEDRAQTFFYILLRDHLPSGTVEKIFQEHLLHDRGAAIYSAKHLAEYAREFAGRLLGGRRPATKTSRPYAGDPPSELDRLAAIADHYRNQKPEGL